MQFSTTLRQTEIVCMRSKGVLRPKHR